MPISPFQVKYPLPSFSGPGPVPLVPCLLCLSTTFDFVYSRKNRFQRDGRCLPLESNENTIYVKKEARSESLEGLTGRMKMDPEYLQLRTESKMIKRSY